MVPPPPREAVPPPFPRAGLITPSSPARPLALSRPRAVSAIVSRTGPEGVLARSWSPGGMRPPPGPWWLMLWLPPMATLPAGAVRWEEPVAAGAALSGNRGHRRWARTRCAAPGLPVPQVRARALPCLGAEDPEPGGRFLSPRKVRHAGAACPPGGPRPPCLPAWAALGPAGTWTVYVFRTSSNRRESSKSGSVLSFYRSSSLSSEMV